MNPKDRLVSWKLIIIQTPRSMLPTITCKKSYLTISTKVMLLSQVKKNRELWTNKLDWWRVCILRWWLIIDQIITHIQKKWQQLLSQDGQDGWLSWSCKEHRMRLWFRLNTLPKIKFKLWWEFVLLEWKVHVQEEWQQMVPVNNLSQFTKKIEVDRNWPFKKNKSKQPH